MTEDRLNHIERLFRNPPSASAMADLGLELIAELRKHRMTPLERAIVNVVPPERERVGDVMQPIGEVDVLPEAKPTPEVRPFKRKAK